MIYGRDLITLMHKTPKLHKRHLITIRHRELFPNDANRAMTLEEEHEADYQEQKVPERGPGLLDR